MYSVVDLEELQKGDKVLVVFDSQPDIVTVDEVDLDDQSFTIQETGVNIYMHTIAVLD